jgi:hypothetical protein
MMGFAALNPSYEPEAKNPGAETRRGNEETTLFDIVKTGNATCVSSSSSVERSRVGGNALGLGRGRASLRLRGSAPLRHLAGRGYLSLPPRMT